MDYCIDFWFINFIILSIVCCSSRGIEIMNHKIYGLPHKQPSSVGLVCKIKSTMLRKCINPSCEYYFYGYIGEKYCSKYCATKMKNERSREYRKEWLKNHSKKG